MRKKLFFAIAGIAIFGLLSTSCSDDETATAVEVSGSVKYDTDKAAGGAVVYLSTTANAADVVRTTIADATGAYSFKDVSEGTYYLTSTYNTENTNLKAGEIEIIFQTETDAEIAVGSSALTQDLSLVSNAAAGTAVIDIADATAPWTFDETHSSIGFNFPYDEKNAPFYGQFGGYEFTTLKFDEATPANTSIVIELDMSTVETGSPTVDGGHGRDGLNGCISGTLGITFKADADITTEDTTALGSYTETAILDNSNIATFTSTAVVAYGNGYKASGTLAFNKMEKAVDFYFQYIEGFDGENRSGDPYKYSSLVGHAKFDAATDFGVESGHVGSEMVTITFSIQLNKAL